MHTYIATNTQTQLALQNWITELLEEKRWKAYFATFMYEPLPGAEAAKLRQMEREIERFYTVLLTRVVRKPRQLWNRRKLPRIFAVPDRPVPKHQKHPLRDVIINDGLHFHAVVLIPRKSRLRTGLKRHVADNMGLYLGSHGKLRRIHLNRIKQGSEKVVDYLLKYYKRNPSLGGELLVLPRAESELR
jgi:hypothetical protein